jgi:beta-mannanase
VASLNKPVLIAELGTSGDRQQQQAWLDAGVAGLGEFDRLRALVYFADRNAPNNNRLTQPDWRLSAGLLARFAAQLDGRASGA